MDQIINGLESHFMTAVFVSGAIALLIVAAVGLVWWRSRHWVERGRTSLATARQTALFTNQTDDPAPVRPNSGSGGSASGSSASGASGSSGAGAGGQGGPEEFGSRLVREAAARAAALRDAWDRSYREARGTGPAPLEGSPSVSNAPTVLDDLLREQRETNALLRQLLDRLGKPGG